MLVSGDWVSPHFNGVRYFEKPILGHWLNAASLALLGENNVAVRLPVALATGLMALFVFFLTRRFATSSGAMLATGIFLTTLLVWGCGTVAVLDAFLALFLTAALALYWLAIQEPDGRRRVVYLALCGAACGAAFLAKGFVAWMIPVVVVGPYLAARREWRTLLTSPWIVIAVAIAVALPWSVLVHMREPDFWHYFLWVQHVQRFAGEDAQHTRPVWFYFAALPIAAWPWLPFLPAAILGLRGGARDKAFLWYVAAWAVMPLLLLSLTKGKLITYILPCFPPLAVLLGVGLERYLAAGGRRAFRAAAAAVGLAFLAGVALLLAAQAGALGAPPYAPAASAKAAGALCLLAIGLVGGAIAFFNSRPIARFLGIGAAGASVALMLQLVLPQSVNDSIAPITVMEGLVVAPDTIVVADASLFGAAAWALKRDDIYVTNEGEIEYGLDYPESRHRWLHGAMLRELVGQNSGRHEVLVICRCDDECEIASQLPPNTRRTKRGNVVLFTVPL
jgi:4-amino-4-deoxy-L-arabinose transferase